MLWIDTALHGLLWLVLSWLFVTGIGIGWVIYAIVVEHRAQPRLNDLIHGHDPRHCLLCSPMHTRRPLFRVPVAPAPRKRPK